MSEDRLASRIKVGDVIALDDGVVTVGRIEESKHHLAGYWWTFYAADGRRIAKPFYEGDSVTFLGAGT